MSAHAIYYLVLNSYILTGIGFLMYFGPGMALYRRVFGDEAEVPSQIQNMLYMKKEKEKENDNIAWIICSTVFLWPFWSLIALWIFIRNHK